MISKVAAHIREILTFKGIFYIIPANVKGQLYCNLISYFIRYVDLPKKQIVYDTILAFP